MCACMYKCIYETQHAVCERMCVHVLLCVYRNGHADVYGVCLCVQVCLSTCDHVLSGSCVDMPLCMYVFSYLFMCMYKWHVAMLTSCVRACVCMQNAWLCV